MLADSENRLGEPHPLSGIGKLDVDETNSKENLEIAPRIAVISTQRIRRKRRSSAIFTRSNGEGDEGIRRSVHALEEIAENRLLCWISEVDSSVTRTAIFEIPSRISFFFDGLADADESVWLHAPNFATGQKRVFPFYSTFGKIAPAQPESTRFENSKNHLRADFFLSFLLLLPSPTTPGS